MASAGFSVGTFTGGGTFSVESLSGTLTPVGIVAWGGSGTATRVIPTAAGALPVTLYAGTLNAGTVSVTGTATVNQVAGTTSARTNFTSATDAQVVASNTSRTGVLLANDADQNFYFGLGTAAVTTSSYAKIIAPGGFVAIDSYTGEVRGLMAGAVGSGAVRVSEVTR